MSNESDFGHLADDLSPADLRMVLGVFAKDVKRLTGNLTATALDRDATAFKRAAHGLAGAAGAVGAKALETACRAAMTSSQTNPSQLLNMAEAIDDLADESLVELAAFIAHLDTVERGHG